MENFTVTTRLTTKDYAKAMYLGFYKKPAFILGTFLGLYFFATAALDYLNVVEYYDDSPTSEIIFGSFLLLAPTLLVAIAVRQFMSNPSFRNEVTYTFSSDKIVTQGLTFKSEFVWTHIIKQKELGKFLILYHTKKLGSFIDKTKLTEEQLQFIKSKIRQK